MLSPDRTNPIQTLARDIERFAIFYPGPPLGPAFRFVFAFMVVSSFRLKLHSLDNAQTRA